MSKKSLEAKIAAPYVRALFDFSVKTNTMYHITLDFSNLNRFLKENTELTDYLNNPVITKKAKREILEKILKSQINTVTFKFLMLLVDRDRINLLSTVVKSFIDLMYETALVKSVEVFTAAAFSDSQINTLIQKLTKLTKGRDIRLVVTVDSSLIGGFLVKTQSKLIDFTIKNKLQQLAKHLDTVLEI
jgi:F-type H+-transporting ATPase subunit delta